MSFRSRGSRYERAVKLPTARRPGYEAPRSRHAETPSLRLLRPFAAGMACATLVLYVLGWDFTNRTAQTATPASQDRSYHLDPGLPPSDRQGVATMVGEKEKEKDDRAGEGDSEPGVANGDRDSAGNATALLERDARLGGDERHLLNAGDAEAVVWVLLRYREFAGRTLEADESAVQDGRSLQGKYIVLDSGNELVNRLRGVLSGLFLGILTDRVFVADITYQKDGTSGLLSALFEGPGYQWDLSQLSPALRRALAPEKRTYVRGVGGKSNRQGLVFDMSEEDFRRWVCKDVIDPQLSLTPVMTLSTVVYPFPLLARNPAYTAHPILRGFAGGGQARIEALETLLTRAVLRPTQELRERAGRLAEEVRERAEAWGKNRGLGDGPPRVVGLHVRTYFVKAAAMGTLEANLKHFADCAVAGGRAQESQDTINETDNVFYLVATDEAATQAVARKVWGDGCYSVPFGLPGSRLEGIKAALVDLLVMGSLDDYVMTPHSSFSELGSTLSYTWLPDFKEPLRTRPNRPIVPLFPEMNDFERRKVLSLMDRRGSPLALEGVAADGGGGACVRAHAAGMSLAIAIGKHLTSMFEVLDRAPCLEGRVGIADP